MRRAPAAALAFALLLCGCASTPPPPGTVADQVRLAAVAVPGASRASVLAALGATRKVTFDSGAEVWLYLLPRGGDRYAEFVILFNRAGVVSKTRLREPG